MKLFCRWVFGAMVIASFVFLISIPGGYEKDLLTLTEVLMDTTLAFLGFAVFGWAFIENEKRGKK